MRTNDPCGGGTVTAQPVVRVVVADDHEVVRRGVERLLASCSDLEVVGEAGTGHEAVRVCEALVPDVVLMDLDMPGGGGLAAIQTLRRTCPSVAVLVLSVFQGDCDVRRCVEAGVSGYLVKVAGAAELVRAVRVVGRGGRYFPTAVAAGLRSLPPGDELTQRELDVLCLMATGASNAGIAGRLGIGEGTVKTHVNKILAKLDAKNRTAAVLAAVRRGLLKL